MTDAPHTDLYAAWAAWERDLTQRLLALADGDGVLVPAPEGLERTATRGGLVARLRRPRMERAALQLVRAEDHLRGECVGAETFGGPFPWTEDERAELQRLGWHQPGRGEAPHYLAWFPDDVPLARYLPDAEAERAARLVAATLHEVLGVGGPGDVEIEQV